jgi:predicted transcriptional regulator
MSKEVQMSIKLETELRAQFMEAAERVHRPAAQILREMMRSFISAQNLPNEETIDVIKEVEAGKFNSYTSADQLYRKLGI